MKAKVLKDLTGPDWTGQAKLYELDPPLSVTDSEDNETNHKYVIASATVVMFSGPETYVFPADAEGNITDWGELDGSTRGILDCDGAIRNAGYHVA